MSVYNEIYWSSNYLRNVTTGIYDTHFDQPQYFSDYYIQNASFFRLDHITLGYNIDMPTDMLDLRVFGSVQNVFVVSPYSGLDPEISNGIDNNVYPRPRTFMLGVTVDF
jgi:iron complex outermembrane receptor protein